MASDSDSDEVLTTNVSAWKAINAPDPPRLNQEEEDEVEDIIRVSLQPALAEDAQGREEDVRIVIYPLEEQDRDEYEDFTHLVYSVSQVLSEAADRGRTTYRVLFDDGHVDEVSRSYISLSEDYRLHHVTSLSSSTISIEMTIRSATSVEHVIAQFKE